MTPTASLLQAVSQFVAPQVTGPRPPVGAAPPAKTLAPAPEPAVLKQPLPADGPPETPTPRGTFLDVTA